MLTAEKLEESPTRLLKVFPTNAVLPTENDVPGAAL